VPSRTRIMAAAAQLIHRQGVAGTTVENVRAAAEVSGSQLYHYFADKDCLVRAVVDSQADRVVDGQQAAGLATPDGLHGREAILTQARLAHGAGDCPLGSLAGQLAESDPAARAQLAAGFERWAGVLAGNLQRMQSSGWLSDEIAPADLAVTLLAALQGGLLLDQVDRDTAALETTLDTLLRLTSPA